MPRIRPLTSEERQSRKLAGVIKKYMEINGVKRESDLGPLIGRSGPTACKRMRQPGTLQFWEMCQLMQKLNIPPEEVSPLFHRERSTGTCQKT